MIEVMKMAGAQIEFDEYLLDGWIRDAGKVALGQPSATSGAADAS